MGEQNDMLKITRTNYISHLARHFSLGTNSISEELRHLISKSLGDLEERFKHYIDMSDVDDEAVEEHFKECSVVETYLMEKFKRKIACEPVTESPYKSPEYSHLEVLKRVRSSFVDDVTIDGNDVIDALMSHELISEDEKQNILEAKKEKRNEALFDLMRGKLSRLSMIEKFIPAMENCNRKLADQMKKVMEEVQESFPTSGPCAVCTMMEIVPVQHLAKYLHENKVISAKSFRYLTNPEKDNERKWVKVFEKVREPLPIMAALDLVFPEVHKMLLKYNATNLHCVCQASGHMDSSDELPNEDSSRTQDKYSSQNDAANKDVTGSNLKSAHLNLLLDAHGPGYVITIHPQQGFSFERPQNTHSVPMPNIISPYGAHPQASVLLGRGLMAHQPNMAPFPTGPRYAGVYPQYTNTPRPLHTGVSVGLTEEMLAKLPPQEKKQTLGEKLFPLITRMYPDLAGKITGMLLEIDNSELLHMLHSPEALKSKVDEAVAVLQAHQAK